MKTKTKRTMRHCKKTDRFAEAAIRAVDPENEYYIVRDLGMAEVAMKVDESAYEEVDQEIRQLEGTGQARIAYFGVRFDEDTAWYELASDRSEVACVRQVSPEVMEKESGYRPSDFKAHPEDENVLVPGRPPSNEEVRKEVERHREEIERRREVPERPDRLPHKRVHRGLKESGRVVLNEAPKSVKKEAYRYAQEGCSVRARRLDNGRYNVTIEGEAPEEPLTPREETQTGSGSDAGSSVGDAPAGLPHEETVSSDWGEFRLRISETEAPDGLALGGKHITGPGVVYEDVIAEYSHGGPMGPAEWLENHWKVEIERDGEPVASAFIPKLEIGREYTIQNMMGQTWTVDWLSASLTAATCYYQMLADMAFKEESEEVGEELRQTFFQLRAAVEAHDRKAARCLN